MQRLLVLLLLALPGYAFATVWELNAIEDGTRPITGHFVENKGVLGAWAFRAVPTDCSFLPAEIPCGNYAQLPPRLLSFGFDYGGPTHGVILTLSLAADLGSSDVIALVPGSSRPDPIYGDLIYEGSLFDERDGYTSPNTYHLLTGTIAAVPEPTVAKFFWVLILPLLWLCKRLP